VLARALPSCPTRRSSDLYRPPARPEAVFVWQIGVHPRAQGQGLGRRLLLELLRRPAAADATHLEATVGVSNTASARLFQSVARRSEEHTSELQSRENRVC